MKAEVLQYPSPAVHTAPKPFVHPVAWNSQTLTRDDFLMPIPADAMAELDAIAEIISRDKPDTLTLTPAQFKLDACRVFMKKVKSVLDDGPGVALLDKLPINDYGRPTSTAIYWLLGSLMGRPVAQSWAGLMLYDVRNTGKTHGNGVRGSVTNVEIYYHTDNSYGLMPPQYIGLLCLQTAMEGGDSRLISWAEAYNRLLAEKPHLVERGFEHFLFDRQREHAPEAPKVLSKPVFGSNGKDIRVCYSSRLMRTGYKMAEQELDAAGTEFLDSLDAIINGEGMQFKMYLEQGQIQFINNVRIGHARGGFTDHEDPDRMRHLIRLWFREHGGTGYDG